MRVNSVIHNWLFSYNFNLYEQPVHYLDYMTCVMLVRLWCTSSVIQHYFLLNYVIFYSFHCPEFWCRVVNEYMSALIWLTSRWWQLICWLDNVNLSIASQFSPMMLIACFLLLRKYVYVHKYITSRNKTLTYCLPYNAFCWLLNNNQNLFPASPGTTRVLLLKNCN
jgi:hypothetical protein